VTKQANTQQSPPLVAHVVHRLSIGGLENGLVNLINQMPAERYRHVIICMTEYTDFRKRITNPTVECYALHKREGQDLAVFFRLWCLLRKLRPAILHTRNLGTLECQLVALFTGIQGRVHGEHGRDMLDIDGSSRRYILLRKCFRPVVQQYIALSKDLAHWLRDSVAVPTRKITQIYNGVDNTRFQRRLDSAVVEPAELVRLRQSVDGEAVLIGTVGRMSGEKAPQNLLQAFLQLITDDPRARMRLRLVLVGDGPLRGEIEQQIVAAGAEHLVWLAGARDDVPVLLNSLKLFVLPSLGEGISNTILEAMACGLPVVATAVGGNPELVVNGVTGRLVPAADTAALAQAIDDYLQNPGMVRRHGVAGSTRVAEKFGMRNMIDDYLAVYDGLLDH
jgi:sugar transferase (PEP-CTERM/EpsH1 system associated)